MSYRMKWILKDTSRLKRSSQECTNAITTTYSIHIQTVGNRNSRILSVGGFPFIGTTQFKCIILNKLFRLMTELLLVVD